MDDIHTPSVSSGRMANGVNGVNGAEPKTLSDFIAEKERIEGELSALSAVLNSHGVTMNTSLTTFDGFPRSDIDVAQIRTTRSRIIYLRNDYKSVLAKIEVAVQEQFASLAQSQSLPARTVSSQTAQARTSSAASVAATPFAIVDEVIESSPAASAGLRIGDRITQFGLADWLNHENLRKVAEVVSQNEERPIVVKVLRNSQTVRLTLTPSRNWGGRGLLGCHLAPA